MVTMKPLIALTSTLAALSSKKTSTSNNPTPAISTDPAVAQYFYLKTHVIHPNQRHQFATPKDGLYVSSYHTGAGSSTVTLMKDKKNSRSGYLNGTTWTSQNERGAKPETGLNWSYFLNMDNGHQYKTWQWAPVTMNGWPDESSDTFYFNDSDGDSMKGLKWNKFQKMTGMEGKRSVGWLACDWVFGEPQLFWFSRDYYGRFPVSCDEVELIPELDDGKF